MNWRQDPRIQKLLEKATIESLLENIFQHVLGTEELTERERTLKRVFVKYNEKDLLYKKLLESDGNAAELLVNKCPDSLCEKTFHRGHGLSPDILLILGKLFFEVKDNQLACELIWCSVLLAIQDFIADRQLKVVLNSYNSGRRFAWALSRDFGRRFCFFETCHDSFYSNMHIACDVELSLKEATEFIQMLGEFQISDELRKEVESKKL